MPRHNRSFCKMPMNYDFLICGLRVRFELPWELKITPESRPFLRSPEEPGAPELTMSFCGVDSLALPAGGGVWHVDSYYVSDNDGEKIWHCPARGQDPYCCVTWDREDRALCRYVRGQEDQIVYTKNLLELLGLEYFLLRFRGLIVHAALVNWEGRGILFCAPSGTGKSTQANLWQQHMGSRTLNGDRAGIRCQDGVWTAWGLPYAGSSGIYCNQSVPIRAVVLLRQGAENRIAPVSGPEAFKSLLPQCNARRWDADFMDGLTKLLVSLIGGVSLYRLECRPDAGAVDLLRRTLLEED